jgi:hypothetical protein
MRLRIYGSSGQLRYTYEDGKIENGEIDERVQKMFRGGIKCVFRNNSVLWYIKASMPKEQFIFELKWSKDKSIDSLMKSIQSDSFHRLCERIPDLIEVPLDDLGWELSTSRNANEVLERITEPPRLDYYDRAEKRAINDLLKKNEKLSFDSSDWATAVEMAKWFRERGSTAAICTGGNIDVISDIDAVIQPNTGKTGGKPETERKIQNQIKEALINRLRSSVNEIADTPSHVLQTAGIESKFGIVAKQKRQYKEDLKKSFRGGMIPSIGVGLLVVLIIFLMVWTPGWILFAELNYSNIPEGVNYNNGEVSATIEVINEGSAEGSYEVVMIFNNSTRDSSSGTVAPGEEHSVKLEATTSEPPESIRLRDKAGGLGIIDIPVGGNTTRQPEGEKDGNTTRQPEGENESIISNETQEGENQ